MTVDASPDMLIVVALAEQNLHLERQVMKREQALVEMARKLQVASSAIFSAQINA